MEPELVRVSFALEQGDDYIDEDAIGADPDAAVADAGGVLHLSGVLRISAGGQSVEFEDELAPLVQEACFKAPPQLLAHSIVVVASWSYPGGELRFDPDGDAVAIRVSGGGELRAPSQALAAELFACGQRFIALLRQVGTPEALAHADGLQSTADQAAAAMGGEGTSG